jgi:hypothetical protein
MSSSTKYAANYQGIDFRKYPEKYRIGRGEQGVLMAEPYKSELLPFWKFKTKADALVSAQKIFELFEQYGDAQDFVGMDMARKFLQMGFTRARRYANHPSGKKYDSNGKVNGQANDWATSEKAESAKIFYTYYTKAKDNSLYLALKTEHKNKQK